MRFSLNDFLFSLSMAIDFAEKDILTTVTNHGKRVALVSGKLGRAMGLSDEEIFDLASYALLHDNGVAQFIASRGVDFESSKEHAIYGENNVREFPFLNPKKNIILYHHEKYDGSGYFGLVGDAIPIFSQIIHFADVFEKMHRVKKSPSEIAEHFTVVRGSTFSEQLSDTWLDLQKNTSFWLDLDDQFLSSVLEREMPKFYIDLSYTKLREITTVFSRIVDSKSTFTARHTKGLASKAEIMAEHYHFDSDKRDMFIIAANLHDVGKLAVSNRILDKNGTLDEYERKVIKGHTYFTRRALENIPHFELITEWASNHHEKLNGKGYPYGLRAEQLDFCSRLLAVLDIYQALTEDRPYRQGMTHEGAAEVLDKMVANGELDSEIVGDAKNIFGSMA